MPLFAETAASTTPALKVKEPTAQENSFSFLLDEARRYVEAGELLKAQEMYRALLKDTVPSGYSKKEIMQEAESLNLKVLCSRLKTDDSIFYVVREGDSLHLIAQKFSTTIDLIKRMNGLTSSRIYPDQELKIIKVPFSIIVRKKTNTLELRLGERHIKTYLVATGKENSTPIGDYEIINKLVNPTWFHAGAIVPSDSPENILGTRWMGFDMRGYGIHGTTIPESIGTQSTAGCVRMLNKDVEELYTFIPVGVKVKVID